MGVGAFLQYRNRVYETIWHTVLRPGGTATIDTGATDEGMVDERRRWPVIVAYRGPNELSKHGVGFSGRVGGLRLLSRRRLRADGIRQLEETLWTTNNRIAQGPPVL
jgi:hypothetical protein